jgi:hypothetical protein
MRSRTADLQAFQQRDQVRQAGDGCADVLLGLGDPIDQIR